MSVCRVCPARLRWARTTTTGSRMPLDLEPSPTGNVRLVRGVAHVVGPEKTDDPSDDGVRYTPHMATCPGWKKPLR